MTTSLPWARAWRRSARDFWSASRPGDHFLTSVSPPVADRLADLLREVDARLGQPVKLTLVDIGCGGGELLELVRERCPDLAERVRWIGIDMRPVSIPGVETVIAEVPTALDLAPVTGIVMAHEWLDEIPCDVVERDADGIDRVVLVDADGRETLGPPLVDARACAEVGVDAAATCAWIERWWPLTEPGDRAEVGRPRDEAWRWMCGILAAGTVLATDYGHVRDDREQRHRRGTLAGYRAGSLVHPAPDGSVNLTAHVALDACADAVPGTTLTRQRSEIGPARLGSQPNASDVEDYFTRLRLRDPRAWGEIAWLRWDA